MESLLSVLKFAQNILAWTFASVLPQPCKVTLSPHALKMASPSTSLNGHGVFLRLPVELRTVKGEGEK